jgi:hypothetical protein
MHVHKRVHTTADQGDVPPEQAYALPYIHHAPSSFPKSMLAYRGCKKEAKSAEHNAAHHKASKKAAVTAALRPALSWLRDGRYVQLP